MRIMKPIYLFTGTEVYDKITARLRIRKALICLNGGLIVLFTETGNADSI
jgi:hypothetical protein